MVKLVARQREDTLTKESICNQVPVVIAAHHCSSYPDPTDLRAQHSPLHNCIAAGSVNCQWLTTYTEGSC